MIASLDAFDSRWPPFASNVTFELFEKASKDTKQAENGDWKNHYVRVRYNAKTLALPFCETRHEKDATMCRLDAFMNGMKKFIPVDFEKECQAS